MNLGRYIYILIFSIIIYGCGKEKNSPLEYMQWMQDSSNRLNLTRDIGPMQYNLQYKTAELLALNDLRTFDFNQKTFDDAKKPYIDLQYFHLTIGSKETQEDLLTYKLNSENEYYTRANYYSLDFQNDIYMVDNNDTLVCSLFHFVRTYGVSSKLNFLLAFKQADDLTDELSDKLVVVNDPIFGTGPVKFKIKSSDLKSIPGIDIKN